MPEREYRDDYPSCDETYVSLLLHHPDAAADDVSRLLGLDPSETHGAKPREVVGTVTRAARPTSWQLLSRASVDSRDFRRHLDFILDSLEGREAGMDAVRAHGWNPSVSVYWVSRTGHGGPTLRPDQAAALGAFGLELWFDIYFADGDDLDEPMMPGELTTNFRRVTRHWRRFGLPRRRP